MTIKTQDELKNLIAQTRNAAFDEAAKTAVDFMWSEDREGVCMASNISELEDAIKKLKVKDDN